MTQRAARILPLDPTKNEDFRQSIHNFEGISMAGEIIEFRLHRDLRRARLYRNEAVPRGPARPAGLDRQIARISGLLNELEDLTRGIGELPPPILVRARASIEETSRMLQPRTRLAASTEAEEDDEDDPQPDVDRGLLERMYRALDAPLDVGACGDRGSVDGGLPAT